MGTGEPQHTVWVKSADAMLKKERGLVVDWKQVGKEDYLLAMQRFLSRTRS